MTRPEWIEVGRISRPHGVQGEVRVLPDSDNPDRFMPGSVVYARPERVGLAGPRLREQVRLTIQSIRGDDAFPIVTFAEVPDRDGAEALRGYVLEVRASELPDLEEDEFYPFDLVGLEVRDSEGETWGRVVDAVDTPAHALLVVEPGRPAQPAEVPTATPGAEAQPAEAAPPEPGRKPEILIPFVKEAVPAVSVPDGYLVVMTRFLDET